MQMGENEIYDRFCNRNVTAREMINILADLNCCHKERIIEILFERGITQEELTDRARKKGRPKKMKENVEMGNIEKVNQKSKEAAVVPKELGRVKIVTPSEVPEPVRQAIIDRLDKLENEIADRMEERTVLEEYLGGKR